MKSVINPLLNKLLRDTARLTRSGKLVDATLKIQRALTGAGTRAAAQNGKVLEGLLRKPPAMRKAARPSRPAKVDAAQTGRFDVGHFNATTGTRDYKLFVPSGHAHEPLPLVVMLHGCKQDPDDFAAGTRMNLVAQELGLIVLYPQQPPRSNMAKCWNWFQPGDQQRGRGEPRAARRDDAPHHRDGSRRCQSRVRRRPLGGRCDGRDPRPRIPRSVRGSRRAFGPAGRCCERCRLGLRSDACRCPDHRERPRRCGGRSAR